MNDESGWTADRGRMLGALIEKGLATPQNYPLTLNALQAACNQTTNRDPITDLDESQLLTLLDEAKLDGLVRFVHPRSGRGVTKYRQVVDEKFLLEQHELALIGVLLLRGPQTVSELRSRTERMASFGDNQAVEQTLRLAAERQPEPLVRELEREPGSRERRWIQLLCPAQGTDRRNAVANQASIQGSPAHASSPSGSSEVAELRAELDDVRNEVNELRTKVDTLLRELGG